LFDGRTPSASVTEATSAPATVATATGIHIDVFI
jgi:hypothetical protein